MLWQIQWTFEPLSLQSAVNFEVVVLILNGLIDVCEDIVDWVALESLFVIGED